MLDQKFLEQLKNLFIEKSVNIKRSIIWEFFLDTCQERTDALDKYNADRIYH